MEKYELIKSEKTVNDMFALGLSFYETHRDNVYITDYDVIHPNNDLVKKELFLVIRTDNKRNWIHISKELLNNKDSVIKIINEL